MGSMGHGRCVCALPYTRVCKAKPACTNRCVCMLRGAERVGVRGRRGGPGQRAHNGNAIQFLYLRTQPRHALPVPWLICNRITRKEQTAQTGHAAAGGHAIPVDGIVAQVGLCEQGQGQQAHRVDDLIG